MRLISHRGNINGKISDLENQPFYIHQALNAGFDVEIDVWYINNSWFLGHDNPQYSIDIDFLLTDNLWCHAKNIEALFKMLPHHKIHCFFHDQDDVTLTSKGFIWTFPNKPLTPLSICVLPENFNSIVKNCYGVCSDFVIKYRK